MKTATKSMAILVVLGALVVLPMAEATGRPHTGVCYENPNNPFYDECYGTVTGCGSGDGIGVGHWYYDDNGNRHTWCWQYVDPPFAKIIDTQGESLP